MSATRTFTFSCDSAFGCLAHATVSGDDIEQARQTLHEVLGWQVDGVGDLCGRHLGEEAAARVDP